MNRYRLYCFRRSFFPTCTHDNCKQLDEIMHGTCSLTTARNPENFKVEVTELHFRIPYRCEIGQKKFVSTITHEPWYCGYPRAVLSLERCLILFTLIADAAAPKLSDSSSVRLVHKPGDTFNVSCDPVLGTPTPLVTWSRGRGGHLPAVTSPRAYVTGSRLIVTSLEVDDGGVYRCTARNVVGEDQRVFRLVVEGEWHTRPWYERCCD